MSDGCAGAGPRVGRLRTPLPIEAGTELGPWLIREYVGQGEIAAVYRAVGEGSVVAVKVLRRFCRADIRARLRALGWHLMRLRHPYLLQVLEVGEHGQVPYLVMEYVGGGTLERQLQLGRPPRSSTMRLLRGLAGALDVVHRAGLVHGDPAPRQILLDADRVLLSDVGLAGLRQTEPDGTIIAVPAASAAYAAPELVMGGRPSAASDVYAFATLAYQMLAGRTPFQGPAGVFQAQLDREPPPPSTLDPSLPFAVDRVLLRGLDRDPQCRWPSCGQLVEALEAALRGGAPVLTVIPGTVPSPTATQRQHRRRWLAAGAALVVLSAAVAWSGSRATAPSLLAPRLTLSTDRLSAGHQVWLTAAHLPAGQRGVVELHSRSLVLGRFRADRQGSVRTAVTVPAGTPAGLHRLGLCWDGRCPLQAPLRVLATSSATPLPSPSSTPTSSPMPLPTPKPHRHWIRPRTRTTPSAVRSAAPSGLPTPAVSPSSTPSATPSPTPSSTPRPSPSPSPTPSPRPSPSPSPTPAPSPTAVFRR
jgi:serine/threonine protein kinase